MDRRSRLRNLALPLTWPLRVAAAAGILVAAASAMGAESKLDPVLRDTLEARKAKRGDLDDGSADDASKPEASPNLEVLIALQGPPGPDDIAELTERGLTVRSTIGEILTGMVALDQVEAVAAYDAVVTIESSRPLSLDSGADDGDHEPPLDIGDLTE